MPDGSAQPDLLGSDRSPVRAPPAEEAFRRLMETLPAAAYTCDADGLITYYNAQAGRLWGRAPRLNAPTDRFCGSLRLYATDGTPIRHDQCWMALALRTNRPYIEQEILIERPDGARVHALAYASPFRDGAGALVGAVNVLVDVTERHRAQEALRDSERRYRSVTELMPAAVYTCDAPSGVIRYFNRRAVELWGREPRLGDLDERFCGSFRLYRSDGTPLPHDQTPMADVLCGGPPVRNQEVVIERPDGSRITVMVSIDPIRDESGSLTGAINVFQDVTARKQAEEELRQAKAAAEGANRAKDRFLAVLSHELRTPLTPVLMSVAGLEREPGLPPHVRDELSMIRRNIALETRLIDDLLDLSRTVNGKMVLHRQDVDVHPLIRTVVDMVWADARDKRLTVALDLSATRDRVHADPARLHQVLWNLLKNALKFTSDGGAVTVRTCNVPDTESATTEEQRDGSPPMLRVEVEDDGIGIDPAMLPSIFDAFTQGDVRTAARLGGLGLGLAISKAVVDLHGGTIRAASEGAGRGASFTLELPTVAVRSTSAGSATHASEAHTPRGAAIDRPPRIGASPPIRILVVDDHPDTLKVLRRLLESAGHVVTAADSVAGAIRAADAGRFDLLISDIGLPDGTGIDVMQRVRLRLPHLPGIALTGFGMDEDLRSTKQAGFAAHLTKPVDLAALDATIRRLAPAAPAPAS